MLTEYLVEATRWLNASGAFYRQEFYVREPDERKQAFRLVAWLKALELAGTAASPTLKEMEKK